MRRKGYEALLQISFCGDTDRKRKRGLTYNCGTHMESKQGLWGFMVCNGTTRPPGLPGHVVLSKETSSHTLCAFSSGCWDVITLLVYSFTFLKLPFKVISKLLTCDLTIPFCLNVILWDISCYLLHVTSATPSPLFAYRLILTSTNQLFLLLGKPCIIKSSKSIMLSWSYRNWNQICFDLLTAAKNLQSGKTTGY